MGAAARLPPRDECLSHPISHPFSQPSSILAWRLATAVRSQHGHSCVGRCCWWVPERIHRRWRSWGAARHGRVQVVENWRWEALPSSTYQESGFVVLSCALGTASQAPPRAQGTAPASQVPPTSHFVGSSSTEPHVLRQSAVLCCAVLRSAAARVREGAAVQRAAIYGVPALLASLGGTCSNSWGQLRLASPGMMTTYDVNIIC